ncbi:MAG TPA: hypothetical protein VHH90_06795 [Polyangia bacterium]|nr:hypothetical protein [Polyangia bacterium]
MPRLAAVALAAAVCSGTASARAPVTAARGRALYTGREPLAGRVRDHRSDLPAAVVVCRGCHGAGVAAPGAAPAPAPAPAIDRALLLEPRPRRGGPPSAYDLPAFCRLLRTGVDPAYVLVAREMPVFDLDDAQCESLWRFVTGAARGR